MLPKQVDSPYVAYFCCPCAEAVVFKSALLYGVPYRTIRYGTAEAYIRQSVTVTATVSVTSVRKRLTYEVQVLSTGTLRNSNQNISPTQFLELQLNEPITPTSVHSLQAPKLPGPTHNNQIISRTSTEIHNPRPIYQPAVSASQNPSSPHDTKDASSPTPNKVHLSLLQLHRRSIQYLTTLPDHILSSPSPQDFLFQIFLLSLLILFSLPDFQGRRPRQTSKAVIDTHTHVENPILSCLSCLCRKKTCTVLCTSVHAILPPLLFVRLFVRPF